MNTYKKVKIKAYDLDKISTNVKYEIKGYRQNVTYHNIYNLHILTDYCDIIL